MTLSSIANASKTSPFLSRLLQAAVNLWESPWGAILVSGVLYSFISIYSGVIFTGSRFQYFNFLADALLHGQTWFRIVPSTTHDLVIFQGHYSLYQSPFPALLIAPFVAILGIHLNDVLYTLIFASLNVGLFALLLRVAVKAEFLRLTKLQRCFLVIFFAVGTVYFTQAPNGRVWNTALIIGVSCVLLAYLAAFALSGWKAWFFTGFALTCAMLTRNHLVFTGIFPAFYLLTKEKPWHWRRSFRHMTFAVLPLVIGLGLLLLYNQTRFGNPFDNGLVYHNMADVFKEDFKNYGAFNFHYIPKNFYYQYIYYPLPMTEESFMGGSLFLMSPLFFAAFNALWKPRQKWDVWALSASIIITNIPILLLMGTGWSQYGPRYTLDFFVPLLLLTALGIERWKTGLVVILIVISIAHYVIGIPYWSYL